MILSPLKKYNSRLDKSNFSKFNQVCRKKITFLYPVKFTTKNIFCNQYSDTYSVSQMLVNFLYKFSKF